MMALRCGSEFPEQITKKSVKLEMPRRSIAKMSSAFFSAAIVAMIWASCSDLMGSLLVKFGSLNNRANGVWHEVSDRHPLCNSLPNLGGREVESPGHESEAFVN